MRVFATGATSFIGTAVVELLVARGDSVTTYQRHTSEAAWSRPGAVHEVLGDITDRNAVAAALQDHDAVLHLAARVGVTGSWADYERPNVEGTKSVIDAAREAGVRRFVHVSSPSVAHAGEALIGAVATPADPDNARGHYAKSKALAEQWALGQSTDEFPVLAIRPHLVWGPGDTQLVARIVERARDGRLALVGSGTALIDTTYIDNAADALVAAIDRAPNLGGEALVVSNGQPRTVSELVGRITEAAGVSGPRLHVPTTAAKVGGLAAEKVWERRGRTDDPPMTSFLAEQLSTAHWFDQRRTREALDWEPKVSLEEGFDRLASHYRNL